MAIRIFGTIEAVGKTIHAGRIDQPFTVTGVLKDLPSNTHLDFKMLYSMESFASNDWYKELQASDWSSNNFPTYYKLKPGVDAVEVGRKLTSIVKSKRAEDKGPFQLWLQPVPDIHFNSAEIKSGYNARPGNIYYVYIFVAVGLFVLVIACVNYVNLSTAFSITRGKEVGVKKIAGARRSQLVVQFITESTCIALAAVVIAMFFVNVLLPSFNEFTGKTIEIGLLYAMPSLLILFIFALVIGVLSGSYPAFYISRLKPVTALKGLSKSSQGAAWVRKGLVVFQFTLSIALIIASLTAYRQIQFIQSTNLGFNQEQLVVLDINSGKVRQGAETIKTELSRIPAAKSVSITSRVPGEWKNLVRVNVTTAEKPENSEMFFIGADEDFLTTFEIDLLKGRNFRAEKSDSTAVLINEAAASLLGIKAPGDHVTIPSINYVGPDEPLQNPFQVKVIGIVKDFHFQSLYQKIAPLMIAYRSNPVQSIDYFTVRLLPGDLEPTLKTMEKVIKQIDPDHPLEYNFLDERLADFYREDKRRGELFGMAAFVSIGIACLGLFSLASFNTEQRTKEIGIRKTLGASVAQITVLLSRDYVKLVAIGFLIAVPISLWALNEWLSSFAYRVEIGVLILSVAGILSVAIALLTVGLKSIKAAMSNPVNSLRNE
jgi:putative ABC transport system permease protein